MSFVHIPNLKRRSLLRGMLGGGAVSVALPFLDCFLNTNGTALASGAPLPVRFGTWYWGLGLTPNAAVKAKTSTARDRVSRSVRRSDAAQGLYQLLQPV